MADQARQQDINSIFKLMEAAIRQQPYAAEDFLGMISDIAQQNPPMTRGLLAHASDYIAEQRVADTDFDWTDVTVEAYRRTLFDIDGAKAYGTAWLVNDLQAMRGFVQQYIEQQTMTDSLMPGDEVKPRTMN